VLTIKVLGPGCVNCQKLEQNARQAVAELGVEAALEHVKDYQQIMAYGVMRTPALVINEKVAIVGRVPTTAEVRDLLLQSLIGV
jgi:small redox-active disulfide protein 2